jgi:hypothetical protein
MRMPVKRPKNPDAPTVGVSGIAVFGLCLAAVTLGADWPQFRGAGRDGISTESGILTSWPEGGPAELWRIKLGEGYSGISVVGDRVYTAYASGSEESWPEGIMTCPSSDKRTVNDSIAWSTANFGTLPVERLSWRANVNGNTVWCSYGQNYFLRPLKEPNPNFMYGGRYLPWDGIQHSWPCQDTNIGTLPSPASTVFYGDNKWDHGGVSPIWGDRWQGGWRHDWYKNYVHFDGHAESVHLLEEPPSGSRNWMMKWRGMANW